MARREGRRGGAEGRTGCRQLCPPGTRALADPGAHPGKHVTGLDGLRRRRFAGPWPITRRRRTRRGAVPRLALFNMHRQAGNSGYRQPRAASRDRSTTCCARARCSSYETVRSEYPGALCDARADRAASPRADPARQSRATTGSLGAASVQRKKPMCWSSALNHFFRGATAAGLPTLLIPLSVFDELDDRRRPGPSLARRARTLHGDSASCRS